MFLTQLLSSWMCAHDILVASLALGEGDLAWPLPTNFPSTLLVPGVTHEWCGGESIEPNHSLLALDHEPNHALARMILMTHFSRPGTLFHSIKPGQGLSLSFFHLVVLGITHWLGSVTTTWPLCLLPIGGGGRPATSGFT